MDDLISKQYASSLEEDAHWLTRYAQGKKDCQRLIEITTTMYRAAWALGKMPSAQPEQQIIRCKDCKHGQCHNPDGTRICGEFDDATMHDEDFCSRAEPWKGEADVGDK